MSNNVGANGQSIVTKKSGGTVVVFPDVCKTPTLGGPVPIPYPNTSKSDDLANGSTSVKINDVPACLKDSNFSKSVGDQAGSVGGIMSNKTGGIAEPVNYSFDVKIEGKNVVRNFDLFVSNSSNTPPSPVMQAPISPSFAIGKDAEDMAKCPYCDEPKHDFESNHGTHIGNGQALRKNIIDPIEKHPWYTEANSLQAHHLICSEAMLDKEWPEYCRVFGYSINHKNNGVILPYEMALACQLHVALHRGNHDKGVADGEPYPRKIRNEITKIKKDIRAGKYCDNPKGLVNELDDFSEYVLSRIDKFKWTITADGKDYAIGNKGCSGVASITGKPNTTCPHDREHGLTKKNETAALPRKSSSLERGQ